MKIQPTTTINIDDMVFQVEDASDEVKQLVAFFDDWREREANTTSELVLVRAALKELQATLLATIQAEEAKKAAPVAANDEVAE